MNDTNRVVIYTDGACSGNPGPGGWGAILRAGEHEKELSGGEDETTNNRMELMAAIAALEELKQPSLIDLFTDSTYVRDGIMKWIHNWKRRGWMTAAKKPVLNQDLWRILDDLNNPRIRWEYTKGHAGDPGTERCDEIAHGFSQGHTVELQSA